MIGAISAFLINVTREALPAVLALLGVVFGGAIAALTNITTARAGRQTQIATATWAKRVEAHQAGFEMWWRVMNVIYNNPDERQPVIIDAQTWWSKNCLYLSRKAQASFKQMLSLASNHSTLVHAQRGDEAGARMVMESWERIIKVGPIMADGAGCHLSDWVLEELRGKAFHE